MSDTADDSTSTDDTSNSSNISDSSNSSDTPNTSDGSTADASKPTDEWVTGDEPPTGPQLSYLQTLAREAGVDIPDGLTKAGASDLIDELQQKSGRGTQS